jgi:hypothetical protein
MLNKPLFFTKHQLERMAKRGISKSVVNSVVNNGEWRKGKSNFSYEVEYNGIIVVLYEQTTQYNVSTCKLNRINTLRAEELREELGIGFWKAVHRIVKELTKGIADVE